MFIQVPGERCLAGRKPLDLIDLFMKFVIFPCFVRVVELNNAFFPDQPFRSNRCGRAVLFFQAFNQDIFCCELKCGHRRAKITAIIAKAG